MKTQDILEGIQSRTKQSLPRVLKYKNLFFAVGSAWSKQQVLYSIAERVTESADMPDDDSVWKALVGKTLRPNDISDKDMEEFVLDWEYPSDLEQQDNAQRAQETAFVDLARRLLKL